MYEVFTEIRKILDAPGSVSPGSGDPAGVWLLDRPHRLGRKQCDCGIPAESRRCID